MKIKDIPNILSFLRILLVPLLILSFVNGAPKLCAALFVISGVSDILDGFIARKFNCESSVGKILDPIADKLTYATVFFCLFSRGKLPVFFIIIFVTAELLQGLGAIFAYKVGGIVVKSDIPGKLAGFSMFAFCFTSLLFYDKMESGMLTTVLCIALLAVITVSLVSYFNQYIIFKRKDKK